MANNTEPKRVLLWSVPRTLSTVFQKCMSFVDGVQVKTNHDFAVSKFLIVPKNTYIIK